MTKVRAKKVPKFTTQPGVMGPCLRPVMAFGMMLWAPAELRKPQPCYFCNAWMKAGQMAYYPMAGSDRGRRLHIRCVLKVEKREADYRAAFNYADGYEP